MNLQGCGTALITPFRPDGSVDEPALHSHVQWQVENGISFLIACGSTGEAPTLTEQETLRVVEISIAAAAGRAPVFAGCTHNATHQAVTNVKRLAQIQGLSGILTANPYYSKPNQEGQFRHFRAIAESTHLPILLYNVPGRTGVNLEPETVLRLAEIPNVIGIKESSGNVVQITELLTHGPRAFQVFAGDDTLALATISLGGVGLISVASNAIPQQMSQMINHALSDDWISARRIHRRYFHMMQSLFLEPNPAPIKATLALLGRGTEHLRLPMVAVSDPVRRRLERTLGELGLLHDEPEDAFRVF